MVRVVLAIAALTLPPAHRARWREEMAAMLIDVAGTRRWCYLADAVLRAPVLAWQVRGHRPGPGERAAGMVTGAGLLLAAAAVVGAVVLPAAAEDGAEALLVLAPLGMAAAIIRDTIRSSAGAATKATVITFGALGPLVGVGVLALAGVSPAALTNPLILLGFAACTGPTVWLVVRSVLLLRDRRGPTPLNAVGILAGSAFVMMVTGLVLQILGGAAVPFIAVLLMVVPLPAFLVSFVVWAVWTGTRSVSEALI